MSSGWVGRRRVVAPKRSQSRSVSGVPTRKRGKWSRAIVKRSFARSLMSANGAGLGPSLKTQLKTVFLFTGTTSGATGIYNGILKTGSAFDPTGSFNVFQPAEFDQWKSLFGRYVVLGGYVRVTVVALGNQSLAFAMYPDSNSAYKTTYSEAASQDNSKYGIVAPYSGGPNVATFYQRFSHAALLGKKGPVTSEDNGALVTADPAAGQFINHQIFIQATPASESVFNLQVEIVQDVYFDRRITVSDA